MQRTIHLFSSLLIFFFHDFCNQILQRESICHLVPLLLILFPTYVILRLFFFLSSYFFLCISFIVTFILVPSFTSFFTSYFHGSLSTFLLLIFSLSSPSFFKVPSPSWNVPDVEFSPFLIWPHLPLCPFRAHPHFVHTSLRIWIDN
jgi:hypothetical protein